MHTTGSLVVRIPWEPKEGTWTSVPWAGGAVSGPLPHEPEPAWTIVSGALAGSVDWGANARVRVTGNLAVSAGATLTVGPGSIVCLDPGVDVSVDGEVVAADTDVSQISEVRSSSA